MFVTTADLKRKLTISYASVLNYRIFSVKTI